MIEDRDWYTLRQAARRVDRSLRTLRRWKRHGMPVQMVRGTNYVQHDELLAWWRARLIAWPIGKPPRPRAESAHD